MQAAAQTLCVMGLFVLYLFWFTMKKRRMWVKSRLRLERKKAGIKFYAAKFGIASIPTVMVFQDGEATDTSVGYRQKAEIAAMLKGRD